VTPPGVDAEEGWQYAHTLKDPDDQWTPEQPPQLVRLLTGGVAVASGFSTPTSSTSSTGQGRSQIWARRRRWVRVMRRRLDIPPLPFLEPDGSMYYLADDGTRIPFTVENQSDLGDDDGQELGSMPTTLLSTAQDYVARARYLVGNQSRDAETSSGNPSPIEVRRAIAKLERATTELRQGILGECLIGLPLRLSDMGVSG
jgi:hypothetical protein